MTNLKIKTDFTGQTIFVGLDVHLRSWHVSILLEKQFFKSFRQDPDPRILAEYLQRHFPGGSYKCAYEAGFTGFWISRELAKLGIDSIAVNAADVPQTNKGSVTKTDKVDSRRIGQSLQSGMLHGIFIPDEQLEADRRLIRCHQRIGYDLIRNKNRIKSQLYHMGIRLPVEFDNSNWSNNFLKWLSNLPLEYISSRKTLDYLIRNVEQLRTQKLNITKDIRMLAQSERHFELVQKLIKVPGIGIITCMTFVVEIGDMMRFKTFDKLNSYIGFYPCEFSSGENQRRGPLTSRQHKRLRELLIESAWVAIRRDPSLALCYNKIKSKKDAKTAIIVIARKLLRKIKHVWNCNEEYEYGIQ